MFVMFMRFTVINSLSCWGAARPTALLLTAVCGLLAGTSCTNSAARLKPLGRAHSSLAAFSLGQQLPPAAINHLLPLPQRSAALRGPGRQPTASTRTAAGPVARSWSTVKTMFR